MTDRDTLNAWRRAFSATLLCWPVLVEALGEEAAEKRLRVWAEKLREAGA